MTREEAIEELKMFKGHTFNKTEEALDMAINALEQEPSTDAVSRQAIYDELEKWEWQELYLPIHFKENIVDVIPSVTPTRPKGKWEWVQYDSNPNIGNWHCSECGRIIRCTESQLVNYPYCHCGADMRGNG